MRPHADQADYNPFETRDFRFSEFEELRAGCPVARSATGGWVVSHHDDIRTVAMDTDHFLNENGGRLDGVVVAEEDRFTFELDPPRHSWIRNAIKQAITPASMRTAAPFIVETTERLIDDFVARAGGDIVAGVTKVLPGHVMAHFLHLPTADVPRIIAWIDDMIDSGFFVSNRTEHGEGMRDGLPELTGYIRRCLSDRISQDPANDDVIANLMAADIDGRKLTEGELTSTLISMIAGASDTSADLLSFLTFRLAEDRARFERLRSDRSLVQAFVREVLRIDSPALLTARTVAVDTEVAGQQVKAGEKVLLLWGSGNRDPEVFPEPDQVKLDRHEAPRSLAFGHGRHLCVGAALARLEGSIFVNTILDKVEHLEFDGPPPLRTLVGITASYPEIKLNVSARRAGADQVAGSSQSKDLSDEELLS
jgi:cytochrome P450